MLADVRAGQTAFGLADRSVRVLTLLLVLVYVFLTPFGADRHLLAPVVLLPIVINTGDWAAPRTPGSASGRSAGFYRKR